MFQDVFQYEIPVLHPVVVHYPIALLSAAALCGLIWLIRGNGFWRDATAVLCFLGAAGAAAAYLTGEAMEEAAEGTPIVEELAELHETLGLITLVVAVAGLVAVATASMLGRKRGLQSDPIVLRILVVLVIAAAAVLVGLTGHVGGIMVWGVAR